MKLAEYISDLLYRYECVIVPEFGGFVANSRSARIDNKTFHPPYKMISFNSHLQNNDGLLANYISTVDRMPFKSAMNFIKFEVDQWKETLREKDLELDDIGTFSLEYNNLVFEPQTKVNYLTDAFGLGSFISQEIERELLKKEAEKVITPVKKVEKTPVVATTPVATVTKKDTPQKEKVVEQKQQPEVKVVEISKEKEKKAAPNYLKYAAVAVIGLSVLGFAGSRLYNNYNYKNQVAKDEKLNKIVDEKVQKATFVITDPLPSIFLDATRASKPYHVIAGAFRYPENAERYVKSLKDLGYEARVLGINSWGLTQVAFESFNTREDAERNLQVIRKTMNKDAWLLIQDL